MPFFSVHHLASASASMPLALWSVPVWSAAASSLQPYSWQRMRAPNEPTLPKPWRTMVAPFRSNFRSWAHAAIV